MLGANPLRPPLKGDGSLLEVQEIFPTLQGEGPYTGWPAVFIRLGGCNLACSFCDTEFESFSEKATADIITRVDQFARVGGRKVCDLVVITGGEPMRQPIEKLCDALLEADYLVQIETNGTLFRDLPYGVDIICSPKPTKGQYYPLHEDMLERIAALKFLISAEAGPHYDVPQIGQAESGIPIYVQPLDAQDEIRNKANLSRALQLCMQHGYRLSLQTHKIIGIP